MGGSSVNWNYLFIGLAKSVVALIGARCPSDTILLNIVILFCYISQIVLSTCEHEWRYGTGDTVLVRHHQQRTGLRIPCIVAAKNSRKKNSPSVGTPMENYASTVVETFWSTSKYAGARNRAPTDGKKSTHINFAFFRLIENWSHEYA